MLNHPNYLTPGHLPRVHIWTANVVEHILNLIVTLRCMYVTYLLSVELYCMNFGHLGDENFLKRRTRQEDILGSSPTAPAVRTLQFKPNLSNISRHCIDTPSLQLKEEPLIRQFLLIPTAQFEQEVANFLPALSFLLIFCMERPYCQYFPAKVDF